jgi:hypothetical protein
VTGQEDTGRTLTRINMEPKLNVEPKLILNAASCIAVLGLILATAVISSCSTGGQSSPSAVADAPDPLVDFTGLWKGTSTSDMNAAKVRISFDIKREGNQLKGTYRCSPLNAVCRDNLDRGSLRGTIRARGFTVSMENTGWCTFMLDEFHPPAGDGEYSCYMNGMLADEGTFEIKGSSAMSEAAPGDTPRS